MKFHRKLERVQAKPLHFMFDKKYRFTKVNKEIRYLELFG